MFLLEFERLGTQYTKNEIPDEYKIYKVFKDDIFGDKIVHLNPYLSNKYKK